MLKIPYRMLRSIPYGTIARVAPHTLKPASSGAVVIIAVIYGYQASRGLFHETPAASSALQAMSESAEFKEANARLVAIGRSIQEKQIRIAELKLDADFAKSEIGREASTSKMESLQHEMRRDEIEIMRLRHQLEQMRARAIEMGGD